MGRRRSNKFLAAAARDALARYRAALPTSTPIERVTWFRDLSVFIGHFPFEDADPAIVNAAIVHHSQGIRDMEYAVDMAQRGVPPMKL
jgi:hypothetical protein